MNNNKILWYIGTIIWFMAGIVALSQSNYFAMIPCFLVSALSIKIVKDRYD